MSRPLVLRVRTVEGESVLPTQVVLDTGPNDTLNDIYGRLDVADRYAVECIVYPNALSPHDQGTTFKELDQTREQLDQQCIVLGLPQPGRIDFVASNQLLRRRSPPAAQPTNAFTAMMAAGRTAQQRNACLSSADVAGYFTAPNSAKAQLAQALRDHLESVGAGYHGGDTSSDRKKAFLWINSIMWGVTPNLLKSLRRDVERGLNPTQRAAFIEIEHLLGRPRAESTQVPQNDEAKAALVSLLTNVFNDTFTRRCDSLSQLLHLAHASSHSTTASSMQMLPMQDMPVGCVGSWRTGPGDAFEPAWKLFTTWYSSMMAACKRLQPMRLLDGTSLQSRPPSATASFLSITLLAHESIRLFWNCRVLLRLPHWALLRE